MGETEHPAALPAGHCLAAYRIESLLAGDDFGFSYRTHDTRTGQPAILLEYLPPELAQRGEGATVLPLSPCRQADFAAGRARFLDESAALAAAAHPALAPMLWSGEANGTAYRVLGHESGPPLPAWRHGRPQPGEDELLSLFLPLLEALAGLHRAGLVHGGIEPDNIRVRDEDGSLVLAGFSPLGLGCLPPPGYPPFERYHAHGASGPWSDLYGLAAILHWLIAGVAPPAAPVRWQPGGRVALGEVAGGRFSPPFLAAVEWALVPDEERRPPDVDTFRAALAGQARPPPTLQPPSPATLPAGPGAPGKPRQAAAFLAFALAALAGYRFLAPPVPPPASAVAIALPVPPVPAQVPPPALAPAAPAKAPAKAKPLPGKRERIGSASPRRPERPKLPAPARPPAIQPALPAAEPAPAAPPLARLFLKITPYGDVYVDGRRLGRFPPRVEVALPPGRHRLEIHGDALPFRAVYTLNLQAGERRQLATRFGGD